MAKNTALLFLCLLAIELLLVSGIYQESPEVELDGDESKRDVPGGPDPPHHNHVQLPGGNAGDFGNGEVDGGTNSGRVDDVRPPDHIVVNIDGTETSSGNELQIPNPTTTDPQSGGGTSSGAGDAVVERDVGQDFLRQVELGAGFVAVQLGIQSLITSPPSGVDHFEHQAVVRVFYAAQVAQIILGILLVIISNERFDSADAVERRRLLHQIGKVFIILALLLAILSVLLVRFA